MKKSHRNALAALFVVAAAFLLALFSGVLNDVLTRYGLEHLAFRPNAEAPGEQPVAKADQPPAAVEPTVKEIVVPIFDLVRVEPSGDAVLAGQGLPKADVEILSGATVIATGRANDAGEWAIVLSEPLKPGAHDLTVRITAPGSSPLVSDQSVAVSVPEGGSGEVLVVLNQPGVASTVLQVPGLDAAQKALRDAGVDPSVLPSTTPPAPAETVVVAGKPAAPAEPAPASPAPPADVASEPTPVAQTGEAETIIVAAPAEPASPVAEPTVTPTPPSPEPNSGLADGTAGAGAEVVMEKQPAPPPAPPAEQPAAAETAEPQAPGTTGGQEASLDVAVQAVETENGMIFVAGFGSPQARVIVYVNGELVGETTIDQFGRWLLETRFTIPPGSYTVRADQIGIGGDVVARAEVPFDQVDPEAPFEPVAGSGSSLAGAGSGYAGEARIGESQTVIIRNGDNLWTLAKRLYGRGVRYSTIYEANTDQIRNPDRIYPGQVFILPEGDTNWQPLDP